MKYTFFIAFLIIGCFSSAAAQSCCLWEIYCDNSGLVVVDTVKKDTLRYGTAKVYSYTSTNVFIKSAKYADNYKLFDVVNYTNMDQLVEDINGCVEVVGVENLDFSELTAEQINQLMGALDFSQLTQEQREQLVSQLYGDQAFIDSLANLFTKNQTITDSIKVGLLTDSTFVTTLGQQLAKDSAFIDSVGQSLVNDSTFIDSIVAKLLDNQALLDSLKSLFEDPCALDLAVPMTYQYTIAGPASTGSVDVSFLGTSTAQGGYRTQGDYSIKSVSCGCEVGAGTATFDIIANGAIIGQTFSDGQHAINYEGVAGENISIFTVDQGIASHCWFTITLTSTLTCE